MLEKYISSLSSKEQKLLQPTPEVISAEIFSEDIKKDIANLCESLRSNGLRIKWVMKNSWEVAYKKVQILRRIRINPEEKNWYVTLHFFPQYNDYITDEEIHNFVWNNLGGTGCDALKNADVANCGHNLSFNIFGKICEKQCCNSQIKIVNPTAKALEHTKTLILTAWDITKVN